MFVVAVNGQAADVPRRPAEIRSPLRKYRSSYSDDLNELKVDALNKAIHKFGWPEIINTDQSSQLTSFAWADPQRRSGLQVSMDGLRKSRTSTFRLWRQTARCDLLAA